MEHTESDPQRQTEQPAQPRLAYYAKDQRVLAWDGSTVAFCSSGSMAFRVAKAMRAAEGLNEPEQAIKAAGEALAEAIRYIEVQVAYHGAMTAPAVEDQILRSAAISDVSIGANSSNTLARFSFTKARKALALLTGKSA